MKAVTERNAGISVSVRNAVRKNLSVLISSVPARHGNVQPAVPNKLALRNRGYNILLQKKRERYDLVFDWIDRRCFYRR